MCCCLFLLLLPCWTQVLCCVWCVSYAFRISARCFSPTTSLRSMLLLLWCCRLDVGANPIYTHVHVQPTIGMEFGCTVAFRRMLLHIHTNTLTGRMRYEKRWENILTSFFYEWKLRICARQRKNTITFSLYCKSIILFTFRSGPFFNTIQ